MSKFSHAFDICFEVISDKEADEVTPQEIRLGILRRLANLDDDQELLEACGVSDTVDMTDDDDAIAWSGLVKRETPMSIDSFNKE